VHLDQMEELPPNSALPRRVFRPTVITSRGHWVATRFRGTESGETRVLENVHVGWRVGWRRGTICPRREMTKKFNLGALHV
jgi:hypothetical protein